MPKVPMFDTGIYGYLEQVIMDFSRGGSASRLFAGMVDDELLVVSNPARLTTVVSTRLPQVSDEARAFDRFLLVQ